ncbi:MAG TPA: FAD-binding oxidoreductase [Candidatus Limnocylindrales bacterium]
MERFVVDRLRETLADRVLTAADADYDGARTTFNATVQRRPAVIVRARTDDDVIAAVVAAADLDLAIAVRGGGHSVAGHAMADGALVVDLRDRREVHVDPDRQLVRVDGGALWEDVDAAAWAHHLAVVGGTFGDTGVGGLALGGGIGWLSGAQGFTCDNLVRAEVVTAAGEKVIAAPASDGDGDPELLWALRGGGGNFGVVTSFTFRAIDPGPILAGYIRYPFSAVKQVLRQVADVAATAPGALELTVVIGPAEGGTPGTDDELFVRVGVCWPGDPDGAREILHPLAAALPALDDDLRLMEYPEVQAMSGTLPFGLRHYWKGHFLRALDESVIGGVVDAMTARPSGRSVMLFEAIRGAARLEPEGGTAFNQRSATWNASALAIWDDPAHDDAHVTWGRAAAERLAVGSLSGAGYANYASFDETIERVRLAFGSDTFARLAKVKARYDPGNRFRFNLNIAPR